MSTAMRETEIPQDLVERAMQLPLATREKFGHLLLDSVLDRATARELIHSRIAQLVSGEVELRDAEELLLELEAGILPERPACRSEPSQRRMRMPIAHGLDSNAKRPGSVPVSHRKCAKPSREFGLRRESALRPKMDRMNPRTASTSFAYSITASSSQSGMAKR